MSLLSIRQIARRAVFARTARYRRDVIHGERRSDATRVLHVLILLTVMHQLLTSQFIRMPLPGSSPSTLFALHEYLGMGGLGLVMLFWLWTLVRHGETKLGRLIPWFSPRRIGAVLADLRAHLQMMIAVARGRSEPQIDSDGAMASAVHGLGLLVLTAMTVTGTVFFFTRGAPVAHQALELHRVVSKLMWAYLIGHAGIAALHHLLGSDIVLRMFWIRRGITVTTPPRPVSARSSSVGEAVTDR